MHNMINTQTKVCLVFSTFFLYVSCDIFTLKNETHVLCFDETLNSSPIFLSPPVVTKGTNSSNFLKNDNLLMDNWETVNAKSFIQGPITDKRWNSFETQRQRVLNISFVPLNSLSFSVFSPFDATVFSIGTSRYPYKFEVSGNIAQQWLHYSVIFKDYTLYLFEGNRCIDKETTGQDFVFQEIHLISRQDIFWKIHDYEYKRASTITKTPTTVTITSTGHPCLILYTSLCEECSLELNIFTGTKNTTRNITASKEQYFFNSWKSNEVEIIPDGVTNITFIRRSEKGESGHWGIDVRFCDADIRSSIVNYELNSTIVKEINSSEAKEINYKCQSLNITDTGENKAKSEVICPKTGKLGSNCGINCEDILGSQFPNCEHHEICQNSNCTCAWGYHGPFCQTPCKNGSWGLGCRNSCNQCKKCDRLTGICTECPDKMWGPACQSPCESNCKICDARSGKCLQEIETAGFWTYFIILCAIILGAILVAIFTRIYLKRKGIGSADTVNGEQGETMLNSRC